MSIGLLSEKQVKERIMNELEGAKKVEPIWASPESVSFSSRFNNSLLESLKIIALSKNRICSSAFEKAHREASKNAEETVGTIERALILNKAESIKNILNSDLDDSI